MHTRDDLDLLRGQVRQLMDRAEIGDLIDRFSRDLDDRTRDGRPFDPAWARGYFTEDAGVEYPVGSATGVEAVAALIDGKGMAPFQGSHHVTANHLIELDGDRAGVRFNLIATHVYRDDQRRRRPEDAGDLFVAGDYYEGEVVRTERGWRFRRQTLHVVWTDGAPPR